MQVLSLHKLQITNDKYQMVEHLLSRETVWLSLTMTVTIHPATLVHTLGPLDL
jgi:hypothetical protein